MILRYKLIFYFSICSLLVLIFHVLTNQKSYKTETQPRTLTLRDIIKCNDKTFEKTVEYRGDYIVLNNFVKADLDFSCDESVTLSAPADYRFLDNVLPLVERWNGPISVAVYAPGYDFFTALQCIAYLRKCRNPLVKSYVTFHLLFDTGHYPVLHDEPLINIYQDEFDCNQKPPYETVKDDEMYKQRQSLMYPINVARNVAKLNAQTYFVFPSDIELYPTRNFIPQFLQFAMNHSEYFMKNSRNVFVLPIFEIQEAHEIPENKTELQEMLKAKTAQGFHAKICRQCHELPKQNDWIAKNETKGLNIFTSAKRQGRQTIWEPFFVCTQKEPLWDDRLNWEGQGNKMCQAYFLCMLDYNFLVFDNVFLIHKPGVKKKKIQNIKFKDQLRKNLSILKNITIELTHIYGNNSKCKIHTMK